MNQASNRERDLAMQFILYTNRSVFLTGRAGTGKTTLLKEVTKASTKRHAVVAPTGVAAINAKGVTIHSMFRLPTTSFAPTHDAIENDRITNRSLLAKNQKLRQERRQLLIELELLIIDEISMVRADLLDAVDFTLRRIKKVQHPFGGVQILVIGDLFQLAPIVKPAEWNTLSSFYNSPFFFDSIGWKEVGAITIELKKVYRQDDNTFISLLNRIRNGNPTSSDIDILHNQYSEEPPTDDIITLTTHNRKAKIINDKELAALDTKEVQLKARVSGHFAPPAYPTEEVITIKEEAQIMFVKNHPDGLYYNGKLGTIESITNESIKVHLFEDDITIDVVKEEWKNTKYTVDPQTKKIVQEDIGTFTQYPFRLAWAITVHKSQGLTFEDVILDVENTFAPGQLYVALSRCRTLEGITLSSKIHLHNAIIDDRVANYYKNLQLEDDIEGILLQEKKAYERQLLLETFTLDKIILYAQDWKEYAIDRELPDKEIILSLTKSILSKLNVINDVVYKFKSQIEALENENVEILVIKNRCAKAIGYFTKEVHDKVIVELEQHIKEWKRKAKAKHYNNLTQDVIEDCWRYVQQLYDLRLDDRPIFTGEQPLKQVILFDPDRFHKKKKRVKGETYTITYNMFKDGSSLQEIANKRALAFGTIQSHMGRLLKEGKVEIDELLTPKRLKKLEKLIEPMTEASSKEIIESADFEIGYAEVRWVRHWLEKEN